MEWHDSIGIIGVAMILIAYFLLQKGQLRVEGATYSSLNAIGALLILFSLLVDFNLSAFVIELFWLLISVYGLVLCWKTKK